MNFAYFFLSIVIFCALNLGVFGTVSTSNSNLKLSHKCLVYGIARQNNIDLSYRYMGRSKDNRSFRYNLTIGNEVYFADAINKKKAQSEVSEIVLRETKYRKPNSDGKKCMYTPYAINIMNEWAQKRGIFVFYDVMDEHRGPPKSYIVHCRINDTLFTQGESHEIKEAKLEAAEKMLEKLKVIDPSLQSNFHEINPVSSLYELQASRYEVEPLFTLKDEIKTTNEDDKPVKTFVIEVRAGKHVALGSGISIKAAKRDAANKILEIMKI